MSDASHAIPIIDVSDLMTDVSAAGRVGEQIRAACTSTGFFYIIGHDVSPELVADCFEANRRFHQRPVEEKLRYKQNLWHRGYQAYQSSTLKSSARFEAAKRPNQLESFFIRHEISADHPDYEKKPLQGPNQWTDDPWFNDVVARYDAATRALGLKLLPALSVAIGEAPDFFAPFFDPPATALRLIHYTPAPKDRPEDLYGIHPHTDYGFLTILAQDTVGGLQIQQPDGAWVDAPHVPGSFVMNIGDILARWTNDHFNSTPHRVVNRSHLRDRYSIGMFFDPNLDTMIETLPGFRHLQHGKYPPIRYGDYFAMRLDANYTDRVGVR